MSTSDGISSDDWQTVRELAVNIYNAVSEKARAAARRRLMKSLDDLETKYGALPSILATRADFVEDAIQRILLFERAYSLAQARGDRQNVLYVAHSLAELYIDDRKDRVQGRHWLDRLRRGLIEMDDAWFADEHRRLRLAVDDLDPRS